MPDVSIQELLQHLVELQKIDAQIYALNRELKDLPAHLESLRAEFERKKSGLNALEERHKALQLDRKAQEGELKSKEEAIAKANSDLSQIKTNKEYTAKIHEIESVKADKSIIEEKILLSYDEGDKIKASIEKEKEHLVSEEKAYQDKKREAETSMKDIEGKIGVLKDQRGQIAPGIDKKILDRYEKVLANKDGSAIVPVLGGSCGGCYMNLPPQVANEIKMHDKLVVCENCARILYLEDDL